jgi:hypothetical protein
LRRPFQCIQNICDCNASLDVTSLLSNLDTFAEEASSAPRSVGAEEEFKEVETRAQALSKTGPRAIAEVDRTSAL